MCDSCASRADQLRLLAGRFESMAEQATDPTEFARLRQAVADLAVATALLPDCETCAGDDVAWADDPTAAASRTPAQRDPEQ